ncbi:hypothetical protein APHAL10511_004493 [Amanita phalloides]|nr:hypothetical protein APHAL10511_004493 [Amanita phalloides]
MVHLRLNESEPNPNPHINFITVLHAKISEDRRAARQLLRALAAQVRPVMKSHGFTINSFEEYEHNQVFSGRNWNNGETVELVLRRPDGSFLPTYWLLSTFCHELAHIKHMNHGPAFQALWRNLRTQVRALQDKGYYGDGYWSSGRRLVDSAHVAGEGIEPGDLPEFMCGGAHTRARPTSIRRFRSERTGQMTKKRKAGTRITSKSLFVGEGSKVAEGPTDGIGTGSRKRAGSKRAREERAIATERRIKALQEQSKASTSKPQISKEEGSEEDSGGEVEIVETDADRRQALLNSGDQENDLLRLNKSNAWEEFQREFNFGYAHRDERECDLPIASGSTFTTGKGKKPQRSPHEPPSLTSKPPHPPSSSKGKASSDIGLGKIVHTEIQFHKREALGLTRPGRTLADSDDEIIISEPRPQRTHVLSPGSQAQWTCLVCTLLNEFAHLTCATAFVAYESAVDLIQDIHVEMGITIDRVRPVQCSGLLVSRTVLFCTSAW